MSTALYRRYRPETFADVIGQEHVTEPLMTALRNNRVNHAYLFSGPRGCGKTTSARILARCLNCAEGPTPTPCGHCESCRDLARDGAGSLDVIEMDAASHGGVDHARDLRERATFAPVRDRYKIFIIDEAHMVTREGFNALLKIVEEPPEHVKFIFATTEPSKVLTTIRSRTHHYPFRLVPPEPLMTYLEQLCREEGVATEPGVLSLVVRAGGGSVRDSLSVLDQLMAGSDENGITYDLAVALLGYTHAALLDDVVDAFAAGDAATVFSSVDRVIQTGQDPRRFVEDLLERFRDLVVVNAVPDSADNILHGMPTDQINRLRNQSTQLGAAELSRSADIINEALNEMTGATSPQLHLELLCARILLPAADHTTRGITSRVDRLERRLSIPRGAGIRQGTGDTATSSAGTAAPEPVAPEPATPEPTAPAPQATAGHETSPVVEQPRGGEQDGPSLPVAPDGSTPAGADANGSAEGRPTEQTPDVREPTDPQDESEETEGSAHPA
ncbi:DNA polymerase III subunit gamma and tau, partial [Kocuria sp.]|uniref:DNA polymerase III subunit gamma and tau n=1 Tax=Kocuria sp. TaxID=1871328 RepID=UPI0026473DCC